MRARWMGACADTRLPVALRKPIYRFFAWSYGVDLEEVRYSLDAFPTFNELLAWHADLLDHHV